MQISEATRSRLIHQHEALDLLLPSGGFDHVHRAPAAGKWSARQHLAHLGRYQEIFMDRIRTILAEESPEISRYRAENDPEFRGWEMRATTVLIAQLRSDRNRMNNFLFGLDKEALERTGTHPRLGTLTIMEWIEFFLLHESHHLYKIFWLSRSMV